MDNYVLQIIQSIATVFFLAQYLFRNLNLYVMTQYEYNNSLLLYVQRVSTFIVYVR